MRLAWLAAPGVPSNLGLRDLRAAVQWLRANVAAFGGDPDRIVLMGESAGSGCVAHVLATGDVPVAGAILQSGATAGTLDAANAAWVGEQFLDAAGATSAADLASAPVDALLVAQEQTVEASLAKVGMMPFHPWVDDDLLTAPAHRAAFPAIPLVVGTTADEMELYRDQVPVLPDDIAVMFLAGKAANLDITDEARVRAALDACGGDLVEAVADLELHVPNELLARAHEARGQRGVPVPLQLGGAGAARLSRPRPAVHLRQLRGEHVAGVRGRGRTPSGRRRCTLCPHAAGVDQFHHRRRAERRHHRRLARVRPGDPRNECDDGRR